MISSAEDLLPGEVSNATLNNMRLYKGEKSSMFGFLGLQEDLMKRVREDSQILQRLGISFDQVSSALANVLRGNSGTKYRTKNGIFIRAIGTHGYQTCPYENCNDRASFDYDAHHETNGMRWDDLSELHPHLIGEHHFFEGRQSAYRLEPIDTILLTGIPVDHTQLITEALTQLRSLGQEDGISLSKANNLFILCQDEPELPDLLNKFIDTIQKDTYKQYSLIDTVRFLRYKTRGNEDKFIPIIDKVENLVNNWDRDNKLILLAIRRVLKRDTNHPIVAGVFLPDLFLVLSEEQQKYLIEQIDRNGSFKQMIIDGQEYWGNAFENLARKKLKRKGVLTDHSTELPSIAYRRLDDEFPDSLESALSKTNNTGWLFIDIEQNTPFCNDEYGSFHQSVGDAIRQYEDYKKPSNFHISKLTSEQLSSRLKFYQWGERYGTTVGNLELVGYCCFQQALVLEKQNLIGEAENKRQQMKKIAQLIENSLNLKK